MCSKFMPYTNIIIHYDEITLKGTNRPFFERILAENIKKRLSQQKIGGMRREGGRVVIRLTEKADINTISNILKKTPGISNFSFSAKSQSDIVKIKKKTLELVKEYRFENKFKTFKVVARRSNKKFILSSPEINAIVGEYIFENTSLKVDIHFPDLEIGIIIGDEESYIIFEKIRGIGGLPTGGSGKAVCLLSGGIDSPVAACMMAKRGLKVILVHFKSMTARGSGEGMDKIKNLAIKIAAYQGEATLYVIPFNSLQREIITNIPSKNRMIVYRRIMFRLGEKIAQKEGAKAIIVGDSLGQVASQTLENLSAAYKAVNMPIFTPLIAFNKQETVDYAKKFGTYDISIQPYADCCSLIASKHPETKANLSEIETQEKNIDFEKLADEIILKIKPEHIETYNLDF